MERRTEKGHGCLYVVATPIGNLEDITLRALRVLREADLIAAEDTRHSRILLRAYDISKPLLSLHEHNEKERSTLLVSKIMQGMNVAYISDAGTPCISDPGRILVQSALEENICVIPVPGPSAVMSALSVCGFPAERFSFIGFLPPRKAPRRRFLESIRKEEKALVFFESPARIAEMLQDVLDMLGDRQVVVAREMTKIFEEIRQGHLSEILPDLSGGRTKGEYTVILMGYSLKPVSLSDEEIRNKLLKKQVEKKLSMRDAVAEIVLETGLPRKKVYNLMVKNCKTAEEN